MPSEEAEIARARVLELFPQGFEERVEPGWVELAVYSDSDGEVALGRAFDDLTSSSVEDGWEDAWRAFHRPVRVAGLWIGPPWEERPAGELVVVVDPGRAFGTGAHPTTRGCIELLAVLERGSLLDAGCGSGVVAVAGIRLGFRPVTALDVDPVAVEFAAVTAAANAADVAVHVADALVDELPPADVLVANIELRAVEALLERAPARFAVTSGYLESELPRVRRWRRADRVVSDGWAADCWIAR